MSRDTCHIEGCEKESRGWGLCGTHWLRWRKWGDPYWVTPPETKGRVCDVEGCNEKHHSHGFCEVHAARFKRHGDPLGTRSRQMGRPIKGNATGYDGAHRRVRRARGPATRYSCVDCGGPAREWSYIGGDPDELVTDARLRAEHPGLRYSLKPDYYVPRCVRCHRLNDLGSAA